MSNITPEAIESITNSTKEVLILQPIEKKVEKVHDMTAFVESEMKKQEKKLTQVKLEAEKRLKELEERYPHVVPPLLKSFMHLGMSALVSETRTKEELSHRQLLERFAEIAKEHYQDGKTYEMTNEEMVNALPKDLTPARKSYVESIGEAIESTFHFLHLHPTLPEETKEDQMRIGISCFIRLINKSISMIPK